MPEAEYRKAPGVNQSSLKKLDGGTPAHYKAAIDAPSSDPTPAMLLGLVVEDILFYPERTGADEAFYAVQPDPPEGYDGRLKEWKPLVAERKEWLATKEAAGKKIISAEIFNKCKAMAESALREQEVRQILEDSQRQVPWFADFGHDGKIRGKGLLDLLPASFAILPDLKTSFTAEPGEWSKHMCNLRMDIQAAYYLDGYKLATGDDERDEFWHIVIESSEPYAVNIIPVGEEFIRTGRRDYTEWLQIVMECEESGEWPGYIGMTKRNRTGLVRSQPPRWFASREFSE